MNHTYNPQKPMGQEEMAHLAVDFIHRSVIHHSMWYAQVKEHLGDKEAFKVLNKVYKKSYGIMFKRLSKILGLNIKDDNLKPFSQLSEEKLFELKKGIAINWLANDGVWFQAIENTMGMADAKKFNDACWGQFSPFEAMSIKDLLNMDQNPGLEGLKKALFYRLYASINKQSIDQEKTNSFVFRMNDCRVQSARKRKNLPDYPCKSAGIIEYQTFASTIDDSIKTECIACPPDKHPDEWYCSWRFYI